MKLAALWLSTPVCPGAASDDESDTTSFILILPLQNTVYVFHFDYIFLDTQISF